MKKLLLCLFSILLLVSCSNELPDYHLSVKKNRTMLAYLVANNNLDGDIMKNVLWMYENLVASPDSCTLLVYYKPTSSNDNIDVPQILEFRTDGYGNINGIPVIDWGDITISKMLQYAKIHQAREGLATDPYVMEDILKTMQSIAPSKSYGLIFGSHATGWLPVSTTYSGRSFGQDGSSKNSINIPELAQTLERSFPADNLDFVMFDACMMGTAEVAYELRNATRYCFASVMETPRIGMPYDRIFDLLYEDEVNWQSVCDIIVSFNAEDAERAWGTYAAFDCTKMEELAEVVKAELTRNKETLKNFDYTKVQQYGVFSYKYFSFDLVDYLTKVNGGTTPDAIRDAMSQVVIAKNCLSGARYNFNGLVIDDSRFCGMGMYDPCNVNNGTWNTYYTSSIAWYKAVGWGEVMN